MAWDPDAGAFDPEAVAGDALAYVLTRLDEARDVAARAVAVADAWRTVRDVAYLAFGGLATGAVVLTGGDLARWLDQGATEEQVARYRAAVDTIWPPGEARPSPPEPTEEED